MKYECIEVGVAWGWPGRPSCRAAAASPKAAILVGGMGVALVEGVAVLRGGILIKNKNNLIFLVVYIP